MESVQLLNTDALTRSKRRPRTIFVGVVSKIVNTHTVTQLIKPELLRRIVVQGVSLPTFAVSPAVAKATVYLPSHVAARMLGGRPPKNVRSTIDTQLTRNAQPAT